MRVIPLQSGSNGNCVYVEAGGVRLLIDAGISGKQAQLRLAEHRIDIRAVDGVLISHDHSDHARSAGIFQRKFGLPVYATERTMAAARRRYELGQINDVRTFRRGEIVRVGDLRIETLPTPHDGVDGAAFVLDDGTHRTGVLTDLGHVFDGLADVLRTLDGVLLESNYDPEMLRTGPYPPGLQRRIRGDGGHLSNCEAAHLLAEHGERLRWACLGHLSEENNCPDLAMETHEQILQHRLPLHVASRYQASGPFEL